MYIGHVLTETSLTLIMDNETYTADHTSSKWDLIVTAVKDEDWDNILDLINMSKVINTYGEGKISVTDGVVYYGDQELHNSLTERLVRMMTEGFNISPMVNFLENLMKNPSGRAVKELYRFLECNSLPLTDDGCFVAYKNVNDNFRDHRTNSFDNSVGAVCQMERNQVMDDPTVTCAEGLHFCSIEYLNQMWGHQGHTMLVKIDPADVVSIPIDYDNSKGRCCRYTVIAEHTGGEKDTVSDTSVWTPEDYKDFYGDYDDYDY